MSERVPMEVMMDRQVHDTVTRNTFSESLDLQGTIHTHTHTHTHQQFKLYYRNNRPRNKDESTLLIYSLKQFHSL